MSDFGTQLADDDETSQAPVAFASDGAQLAFRTAVTVTNLGGCGLSSCTLAPRWE